MPTIEAIADARIRAEITRELEALARDIIALQNRNAAKGLLRSGATVEEAVRRCAIVFERSRDVMYTQVTWVMKNTLLCTRQLAERLLEMSRRNLDDVLQVTDAVMRDIVTLVGNPGLFDDMHERLVRDHQRALTEVSLQIDGELEAEATVIARKLIGLIASAVKKLFGLI